MPNFKKFDGISDYYLVDKDILVYSLDFQNLDLGVRIGGTFGVLGLGIPPRLLC